MAKQDLLRNPEVYTTGDGENCYVISRATDLRSLGRMLAEIKPNETITFGREDRVIVTFKAADIEKSDQMRTPKIEKHYKTT